MSDKSTDADNTTRAALRNPVLWVLFGGICVYVVAGLTIDSGSQLRWKVPYLTLAVAHLLMGSLIVLLPRRCGFSRRWGLAFLCTGLLCVAAYVR
jgi:hypothetical protein